MSAGGLLSDDEARAAPAKIDSQYTYASKLYATTMSELFTVLDEAMVRFGVEVPAWMRQMFEKLSP